MDPKPLITLICLLIAIVCGVRIGYEWGNRVKTAWYVFALPVGIVAAAYVVIGFITSL